MTEGALDGIRVLEFANYVSGPYAGMLLSGLGADVIKAETTLLYIRGPSSSSITARA